MWRLVINNLSDLKRSCPLKCTIGSLNLFQYDLKWRSGHHITNTNFFLLFMCVFHCEFSTVQTGRKTCHKKNRQKANLHCGFLYVSVDFLYRKKSFDTEDMEWLIPCVCPLVTRKVRRQRKSLFTLGA